MNPHGDFSGDLDSSIGEGAGLRDESLNLRLSPANFGWGRGLSTEQGLVSIRSKSEDIAGPAIDCNAASSLLNLPLDNSEISGSSPTLDGGNGCW